MICVLVGFQVLLFLFYDEDSHSQSGYQRRIGLVLGHPYPVVDYHYRNGLFVYLGFYVTFNTVQVISRRVVGRAEETSTYSSLGLCTLNCRPMASNYQLSHLWP